MKASKKATTASQPHQSHKRLAGTADPMVVARLTHAVKTIAESGRLHGLRSKRLSARVDPGLVEAAKAKSGITNDSELINAALAAIAAPDDFGAWFVTQAGTLPSDFEIDF